MINRYTYNTDLRMPSEFRTLEDVKKSQRWRDDHNTYVMTKYVPTFIDGADTVLYTFDELDELVHYLHNNTDLPKACTFACKGGKVASLDLKHTGGTIHLGSIEHMNSKAKIGGLPYTKTF